MDSMVDSTNNISELIDRAFSSEILNHPSITKLKLIQNVYYAIIQLLRLHDKINNLTKYQKLRSAIRFVWKNRDKNKTKSIDAIQKLIFRKYNELCSTDSSDESDESSDSEKTSKNRKSMYDIRIRVKKNLD